MSRLAHDRITLDMTCLADREQFLEVNDRWVEVLGRSREQLIGRPFRELVHPDDLEATAGAIAALEAGEPVVGFENRYRRADGSWASLLWSAVREPESGLFRCRSSDISREREAIAQRDALMFVLDVQAELQALFLAQGVTPEWWRLALERLVLVSESAFGFIARVEADANGDTILRALAISDPGRSPWFRKSVEGGNGADLVFRNLDSLFGATVRTGQVVISSDPANDPRRCGLPPGHPPLHSYMGLPLKDGDTLVGMVGLANRLGGFTPELVDDLAPLTLFISQIIGRDLAAKRASEAAREAARRDAAASSLALAARQAELLREANAAILASPDPAAAAHAAVAAMMGLESEATMTVYRADGDDAVVALAGDAITGGPRSIRRNHCRALTEGGVHVSGPGQAGPSCEHADQRDITVCAPVTTPGLASGMVVTRAPLAAYGEDAEAEGVAFLTAATEQLAASLTEAAVRADLARSARTDHLTGLANRLAFLQALEAALARPQRSGRPVGLILADIDDFKGVNDAFGHEAGDHLLREVAARLQQAVRNGDVLARLGGDEFIVMMAPTEAQAVEAAARRIVKATEDITDPDGAPLSMSAGGVMLGMGAVSWHDAYAAVDAALYRAKAAGKGRFLMSPMVGTRTRKASSG